MMKNVNYVVQSKRVSESPCKFSPNVKICKKVESNFTVIEFFILDCVVYTLDTKKLGSSILFLNKDF